MIWFFIEPISDIVTKNYADMTTVNVNLMVIGYIYDLVLY